MRVTWTGRLTDACDCDVGVVSVIIEEGARGKAIDLPACRPKGITIQMLWIYKCVSTTMLLGT